MFCTVCGKENREGAKFCRYCGSKLEEEIICPRCGSQMEVDDVFCERCGYKKGDQIEVKPVVEEKPKEEYPVFESETPYEYGEEKPIIEEYDVPASNKTIEDYLFDDYKEVPEVNDPFIPPARNESFMEIEKSIPIEEKKEIVEEKKKEVKEEKKVEIKEEKNGKFINVLLLISSIAIITMLFLPFYTSSGNGEYIRTSFATMRETYFMNYISFIRLIFIDSSVVVSSKIDSLQYLFITLTMTIILVSMLKILLFAIKNLKDKKYSKKYDIPFVITLICIIGLFVGCNVNSIPVYVVLSLSLAVLIHKYFYEKKFDFIEFVKLLFLFVILGFFLLSYRNIGMNGQFDGFTSWSKFGIGRFYSGVGSALEIGEDLNYIKDLISFLGWATSICLGLGLLMAFIGIIKIIRAIYSDEPSNMPVISMSISVGMIIASLIFWVFAKSNCENRGSAYVLDAKLNAWIIFALLAGLLMCVIFGLMNYRLSKAMKKEKSEIEEK